MNKVAADIDFAAAAAVTLDSKIGLYSTASTGEVELAIDAASTAATEALDDITGATSMESILDANATRIRDAVAATKTELDLSATAIGSSDDTINRIPIGSNPSAKFVSQGVAGVSLSNGYVNRIRALIDEKNEFRDLAAAKLRNVNAKLQEARTYLSTEGGIIQENAQAVVSYLQEARGFVTEAQAFQAYDAQVVSNHLRLVTSEGLAIQAYVNESSGYMRETVSRLRVVPAINSMLAWAREKRAQVRVDLKRLEVPRQKTYNYPTS